MNRILALLTLSIVGCETRGLSKEIALERPCYTLAPGGSLTVHAQVTDTAGEGATNVKVRWSLFPTDGHLTIASESTTPVDTKVAGLNVSGVISVTVQADTAAVGAKYSCVVQTLDDSALNGSTQILITTQEDTACSVLDAGVGASPEAGVVDSSSSQ